MIRRHVGHTGLQVSRLGLGTMTWGSDVGMPEARSLLTTFHQAGGTMIDTAAAYGRGAAEQMLGTLLDSVVPRDEMIIATKAGFGVRDGHRVVDTSRSGMLHDLDQSLERLGTDWIDLWQVHAFGEAPIEETLAAMDYAVSSGRVRYVGVSNFVGWQTAYAAAWQRAVPGRTPVASGQAEYSLLARRAEMEILPATRRLGMGFFPWSPLGRGVLTGKYRAGLPRGSRGASDHFAWFVEPYLEQRYRGVVEAVTRAADGMDLQPLQVALLWVRDAPGVTAPLLGARTADQLITCLRTEEMELPAEIAAALDDVSGGPVAARGAETGA
ncbi:aldo/keto reductase [Naumannella cuiyingiana]|uniref:Aryl-alcohol dehydrogenase-like predicted oxidoreductase n=1 Tax=Naumannella cuiyingiana TaxID=1347891 RepID=A0A7Z0DBQ2_9ACTN|nr:aldo/keto reductase [Naumannella cuiyingiana]NYI72375.1 aryl-alcohol dehydrogenase-like predicted oxidoreductase [Naumannella cuiyingiana]